MTSLSALWLPIVLSAVFVFIASSIIHMATSWHKNDYQSVPNESKVMDTMRPLNIPPGDYMMPRAGSMKEMTTPEFMDKMNKGPIVIMTVRPTGKPSMTSNLVNWFLYSLVISVVAAYVASRALGSGAVYLQVFRFAGVTAFAGYSLGLAQMSIWWNRSWATTLRSMFDGLLYGLITAGTLGWLWPR